MDRCRIVASADPIRKCPYSYSFAAQGSRKCRVSFRRVKGRKCVIVFLQVLWLSHLSRMGLSKMHQDGSRRTNPKNGGGPRFEKFEHWMTKRKYQQNESTLSMD